MKKILLALLTFSCTYFAFATGVAEGFNYQAVVRDASGNIIANQPVSMRVSIRDASPTGPVEFQQTDTVIPNQFGIITVIVGGGSITTGSLAGVTWGNGSKFMQVEADVTGSINYTDMGTTQLLSVPYALYAATSGSSTPGPQGPVGPAGADGAVGSQGPIGPQGATGADGAQGITGPQGSAGIDGAQGVTGPQGATGADGATGARGEIGAVGPQGVTGADGAVGPKGDTGAQGPAGLNGISITGPTGPQGPTGVDGTQGTTGPQGSTGAVGPQGPTGVADSVWSRNTTGDIYNNNTSGRVGINNTNPQSDLDVNGFTKLGPASPLIKMARVTGNMPGANSSASTNTGIPDGKVLNVMVTATDGINGVVAPLTNLLGGLLGGFEYDYTLKNGVLTVKTTLLNSLNIIGKPYKAVIIYEE